ncbi:MAG: hypothetical protein JW940_21610 [Polyangiaceae bacterium]|nr:hypothetical protein [Polyangiaceae bacterium]
MAYTDQYALAREDAASTPAVRQQVHIAMLAVALAVVGEAKADMSNKDWAKRHRYCVALLNDPDAYIQRLMDAVAAGAPALGTTPTDGAVLSAVIEVMPDLAGLGQADWL